MKPYKLTKKALRNETAYKEHLKKNDFDAISAKWEAILESEGLGVLEPMNENPLPRSETAIATITETTDYYALATDYLNNGHFKDETERSIWQMHCAGLSYRKIGESLNLSYEPVARRINRVKKRAFA